MNWQFYLIPSFHSTDGKGGIWKWELDFLGLNYSLPIIFLLLTFCPLSLAVARISEVLQVSNTTEDLSTPTAREIWRDTGRKAFTVFAALLIFILLMDVVANLYGLVLLLVPSLYHMLPFGLTSFLMTVSWVFHIYIVYPIPSTYRPTQPMESPFSGFHKKSARDENSQWNIDKFNPLVSNIATQNAYHVALEISSQCFHC